MADLGFCLLVDGKVHVPYWLVTSVRGCSGVSEEEIAFVSSIKWLCEEVDRDNQSTLACLGGIGVETAKKIITKRKEAEFSTREEFLEFLEAQKVVLEESEKFRVFV